jgi:hypothetical protein
MARSDLSIAPTNQAYSGLGADLMQLYRLLYFVMPGPIEDGVIVCNYLNKLEDIIDVECDNN